MEIGKTLRLADDVCDYVPVVSTVSNLVDLFQKTVVLPSTPKEIIWESHYYTHLDQKSFSRCVVLLIPVIGNILVGIYDFVNRKYNDKEFMLAAVQQDVWALRFASARLKDDPEFMLAAVQQNGWALQFASDRLKDDKEVVLAAVQQNGTVLEYASDTLKADKEFMLEAVQQNGRAFIDVPGIKERFEDDEDIGREAYRQYPILLSYFSKRVQELIKAKKEQSA